MYTRTLNPRGGRDQCPRKRAKEKRRPRGGRRGEGGKREAEGHRAERGGRKRKRRRNSPMAHLDQRQVRGARARARSPHLTWPRLPKAEGTGNPPPPTHADTHMSRHTLGGGAATAPGNGATQGAKGPRRLVPWGRGIAGRGGWQATRPGVGLSVMKTRDTSPAASRGGHNGPHMHRPKGRGEGEAVSDAPLHWRRRCPRQAAPSPSEPPQKGPATRGRANRRTNKYKAAGPTICEPPSGPTRARWAPGPWEPHGRWADQEVRGYHRQGAAPTLNRASGRQAEQSRRPNRQSHR